jgi:cysteinyl-tRNA synthetase
LDDDLNTPEALAALFDMVHAGNKAMDDDSVTPQDAVHALAVLQRLDSVFDILQANEDGPDDAVVELAAQRQSAREAKDFAESDRLRDAIAELGWSVLDTAEGPKLRRVR